MRSWSLSSLALAALAFATPARAQAPYLVKDIDTVPDSSPGLRPNFLTPADDFLYFFGEDAVHGRELRRTAGTAAKTILVRDLSPGPGGGTDGMTSLGNMAFFTHGDAASGAELWHSDGSVDGNPDRPRHRRRSGRLEPHPTDLRGGPGVHGRGRRLGRCRLAQ